MPKLAKTTLCSGCSACYAACPQKAIQMQEDQAGFLTPIVDNAKCIECRRCEQVCPVLNQFDATEPKTCYAAWSENNELRLNSSSGGVFGVLAQSIIDKNGIVFGCAFIENDWRCHHTKARTHAQLKDLLKSKYIQSDLEDSFTECKHELATGKRVLFSGTPCQIAGLLHYLGHSEENLLTVEVICHGTPSPDVWKTYLHELQRREDIKQIVSVDFRNKKENWKNSKLLVRGSSNGKCTDKKEYSMYHWNDPYMTAFLNNLSLRSSCYHCSCKAGKSHADITLGDFWGFENIHPGLYDEKGISAVMLHTAKAQEFWIQIQKKLKTLPVSADMILQGNRAYLNSYPQPAGRKYFMRNYHRGIKAAQQMPRLLRIYHRILKRAEMIIKKEE